MQVRRNVYLDANAIIRFSESEETQMAALYEKAVEKRLQLYTSELTLAEVLVLPIRDGDHELVEAYKAFLRSDPTLNVVPVTRAVLQQSAELRAVHGGKGPDAIHCATAVLCGCTIVVSSDRRLRMPRGLVRIDVEEADTIEGDA